MAAAGVAQDGVVRALDAQLDGGDARRLELFENGAADAVGPRRDADAGNSAASDVARRGVQQRRPPCGFYGGEAAAEKGKLRLTARAARHQRVQARQLLPQRDFPAGGRGDFVLCAEYAVVRAAGVRDEKRDRPMRGAIPHP